MTYTPKQLKILEFIIKFQGEHKYSPSYAEIAKQFGVSTITIFEHLNQLERKGAIRKRRHGRRSIEIIESLNECKRGPLESLVLWNAIKEYGNAKQVLGRVSEKFINLSCALPIKDQAESEVQSKLNQLRVEFEAITGRKYN